MRHPEPLPASLHGVPFHVREAAERDVSRSRTRASDLVSPFFGVRTRPLPPPPVGLDATAQHRRIILDRCRSYAARAGADEFFSHVTAAILLGLPLPLRLQRDVSLDVSVFAPSFPPQSRGIRGHRLSRPTRLVVEEGLPCSSALDAWVQLAPILSVDEVIYIADALVRRKRPFSDLAGLVAVADAAAGRPGRRKLALSLPEVREGVDSPKETQARLIIVRSGLPEPVIGYEVHDDDGFFVGTPDLAYVTERIALDYEGDGHRSNTRVFRDDVERKELFADARWRYIRLTEDHVSQPHRLVARVARALRDQGWRP